MLDQRLVAFAIGFIPTVVVGLGLCLWWWRRRQRQRRLARMVYKPPVTTRLITSRWKKQSYAVDVTLGFGLLQGEAEEFAVVTLDFDWDEGERKYLFVEGQLGVLLKGIWRHGIGKEWTGVKIAAFRLLVQSAVAKSILQHEESMASIAHSAVGG